jgi:hypothetical protein
MKDWVKGGIIGFLLVFVGLWIFLIVNGHEAEGWRCTGPDGLFYCDFAEFMSSLVHWIFVVFFSWVGFVGGAIDVIAINKAIKKSKGHEHKIPLRITFIIVLSIIIVLGVIGVLAFEDWVTTMIYSVIFGLFVVFISWYIEKKRYN